MEEKPRVVRPSKNLKVQALQEFFKRYHSPLAGSEQDFIDAAYVYGLDWRLLPAIAGDESTFETAGNVTDHNPFGYMCPGKPCYFNSYSEAIWATAKTIGTKSWYADFRASGQIEKLAEVYNQAKPQEWTQNVEFFMNKL